jgi:hypothetical protein
LNYPLVRVGGILCLTLVKHSSPVLTNTVNLLLGSDKDMHIRTLFGEAKNATELEGYVYEALRMVPSHLT